ncbi:hypothetical protein PYCCODRAFT_1430471 [Trametes coccinea BRFM310]|uniref:Uncharacterized protein n=1 Tax=Trametes coccinea (strain BRFM310) TaxID=1353009 RepID=A0A1Y2J1E6_TRAC3|nr:hypothetical protein PYCCODRAFT_1430471 [Trametes coccinea BRFM310]
MQSSPADSPKQNSKESIPRTHSSTAEPQLKTPPTEDTPSPVKSALVRPHHKKLIEALFAPVDCSPRPDTGNRAPPRATVSCYGLSTRGERMHTAVLFLAGLAYGIDIAAGSPHGLVCATASCVQGGFP